jgi:hypothetical protein
MTETSPLNPNTQMPHATITERYEPSKHDEIVNDILKHLTTLNTGLLAILSAFSAQVAALLTLNRDLAMYFLYAFYMSLLSCMIGFMITVMSPHIRNPTWRGNVNTLRDVVVFFAAIGYIGALMLFITVYSSSIGLLP